VIPPRRYLSAAILLTLAALPAFAQPTGTGTISGTVVEASNNDPVRKAVVTLTWQASPRSWAISRTDSSGQFQFEGLPPGKYDLRATKAGEGAAIYGASSVRELGELISLEDGETRAGVKLRFLHSATISGKVLDPHSPGRDVVEPILATLVGLCGAIMHQSTLRRSYDTISKNSWREITLQEGQTATVDLAAN
jgi:hypothetical protein